MIEQAEAEFPGVDQRDVVLAPTYFVDGPVGVASVLGVARITLGAFKVDMTPGATLPRVHPVVTLVMSEDSLLRFARDMVTRAEPGGIFAAHAEIPSDN